MQPGVIRIIGGQWRGRRLPIPAVADVRPTPDRVRETLFNWLAPYLPEARCLDAFAGSGALGFEALSRGAAAVWMFDHQPAVIAHLTKMAHLLSVHPSIQLGNFLHYVFPPQTIFDIVFRGGR